MAFNGNFMCTSFKKELLYGAHDFDASSGDTFKIALYTNSATLNASTTALQYYSEYDVYLSNQPSSNCSGFWWR